MNTNSKSIHKCSAASFNVNNNDVVQKVTVRVVNWLTVYFIVKHFHAIIPPYITY